jgi:hypothetical protein
MACYKDSLTLPTSGIRVTSQLLGYHSLVCNRKVCHVRGDWHGTKRISDIPSTNYKCGIHFLRLTLLLIDHEHHYCGTITCTLDVKLTQLSSSRISLTCDGTTVGFMLLATALIASSKFSSASGFPCSSRYIPNGQCLQNRF